LQLCQAGRRVSCSAWLDYALGTTQTLPRPPRTAQRGLVWAVCAVLKTAQSWQLTAWPARAARAALASSRPGWVVFETTQIAQSCQLGPGWVVFETAQIAQLWPGLARAARAAWRCLYVDTNRPDRPARSWCARSRPGRPGHSTWLVVCPRPGREYVPRVCQRLARSMCSEYVASISGVLGFVLIAWPGRGREGREVGTAQTKGPQTIFCIAKTLSGNFLQSRIQSNMIRA
jgi:hypothetical protein